MEVCRANLVSQHTHGLPVLSTLFAAYLFCQLCLQLLLKGRIEAFLQEQVQNYEDK